MPLGRMHVLLEKVVAWENDDDAADACLWDGLVHPGEREMRAVWLVWIRGVLRGMDGWMDGWGEWTGCVSCCSVVFLRW